MNNINLKISLVLLVVTKLTVSSCKRDIFTTNQSEESSNNFVSGSNYDGEPTELIRRNVSVKALSRRANPGFNCEEHRFVEERVPSHFSILDGGMDLMWPGNLIQGNTIKYGDITSIPIGPGGRNPIEVKVDAFLNRISCIIN